MPESIGPSSGALFIGGAEKVCVCADDEGAILNREVITIPIAMELIAIKAAENNVVRFFDIISSSKPTLLTVL